MLKVFESISEPSTPNRQGVCCTLEELILLRNQTIALPIKRNHKSRVSNSGENISALRGRGIDFNDVRAYQAGDEIRSIDWRVTARTGKAHTKVFIEEKEQSVFILLDQSKSMFFGSSNCMKSVQAARAACIIAWSTIKKGDRVGGVVFSDREHQEFKPKGGKRGVLNLVNTASDYSHKLLEAKRERNKETENEDINTALDKLRQISRPGSLVYIFSDFSGFNQETVKQLTLLARHNDIIPFFIHDKLEKSLPPAGSYIFADSDNTKQTVELQTQGNKTRESYEEKFKLKLNYIETELSKIGIGLHMLNCEHDLKDQL